MSKLEYKGHEIVVKYDKSLETPILHIDGKVYSSGPVFNSDKEAVNWGKSIVDHIESQKSVSALLVRKGIQVKNNRIAKSDLQKVMNIIKAGYGDIDGEEPGQKDIDRLKGILEKSKGDPEKAKKLALNVAKTIKEADKAIRRAKAAKLVFEGKLADEIYEIFMDAANHAQKAAASAEMYELSGGEHITALKDLEGKSNNWSTPETVKIPKGTVLEVPNKGTNYGDVFAKIIRGECTVESYKGSYKLSAGESVGLREGHKSSYPYDIGKVSLNDWHVKSKVSASAFEIHYCYRGDLDIGAEDLQMIFQLGKANSKLDSSVVYIDGKDMLVIYEGKPVEIESEIRKFLGK